MASRLKMPVVWSLPIAARPDGQPLQHWLYKSLRQAIVTRRILPDSRMPSSRRLAGQYRIARGTVQAVYGKLIAEGYLVSRAGSHTRVCARLPDVGQLGDVADMGALSDRSAGPLVAVPGVAFDAAISAPDRAANDAADARYAAGAWISRLAAAAPPFPMQGTEGRLRAFMPHHGDTRGFPIDTWRAMHVRLLRSSRMPELMDADPRGARSLRAAIAGYLRAARGVMVSEDEIVVVASVQQAFDICLRLLTHADDAVWIENPGYPGVRQLAQAAGVTVIDVPVDAEGMRVADGLDRAPDARLAYVTPSRHAPLGVPLSPARCQALLAWAQARGAFVFEDSYDSDYRYAAPEVPGVPDAPVLKRMPLGASRVILAGTFSKLLFPALRIAYVALPAPLVEPFARAASLMARHPNTLAQLSLAHFMMEGHLDQHIRRTRKRYAARAEAFAHHGRRLWQGWIEVPAIAAGLDVAVRLGGLGGLGGMGGVDEAATVARLRRAGVDVMPLGRYAAAGTALPPGLVMGFAPFDEAEIARAATVVARALAAGSDVTG